MDYGICLTMVSIEEHKKQFETKVLQEQEKKGKNSKKNSKEI